MTAVSVAAGAALTAGQSSANGLLDCLIIGGGPAGLTAAIYLARFHLSVVVVDDGQSRLALVPRTRNHAGFPEGIAGPELLDRMRRQAEAYGVRLVAGELIALTREADAFVGRTRNGRLAAKTVLLATGVVNRRPAMADDVHDAALAAGLLRYCPICDAYEVTDRPVAVLGTGDRGLKEAEFLRAYTADVTLIAPGGAHDLTAGQRAQLERAGVAVLDGPCVAFEPQPKLIDIVLQGERLSFASVYPALGSDVRSELAIRVGASLSEEGCMLVDSRQRTIVPGVYAAGDVVLGLDQISNAMGQGGVAATTIRNDLAAIAPLRR